MVMHMHRLAEEYVFSDKFGRQMRFIAGPRQCGKTTIAKKKLLSAETERLYYNWDRKEIRSRYRKEGDFLGADILDYEKESIKWTCLDEIHKYPGWKNILKDFFDTHEDSVNFIITGSARLDMFRKSGDSLAGRYFLFRLNPLILSEVLGHRLKAILPGKNAKDYIENNLAGKGEAEEEITQLLRYSGFPEPFLTSTGVFHKKWQESYSERIVKEDLRDLSHIHNLEKVMELIYFLPGRIGSPLSINSLREDIEVNYRTVQNYLRYLELSYVTFTLSPYSQNRKALVKKEKKVYFYDWTAVANDAIRFENYLAVELKARIEIWNDTTEDRYTLRYVRNRDGRETDFLIIKNESPWLLLEAKLKKDVIARHHFTHSEFLGNIPIVQVTREPGVIKVGKNGYTVSASRFLG